MVDGCGRWDDGVFVLITGTENDGLWKRIRRKRKDENGVNVSVGEAKARLD
jgi:hypothetical protein